MLYLLILSRCCKVTQKETASRLLHADWNTCTICIFCYEVLPENQNQKHLELFSLYDFSMPSVTEWSDWRLLSFHPATSCTPQGRLIDQRCPWPLLWLIGILFSLFREDRKGLTIYWSFLYFDITENSCAFHWICTQRGGRDDISSGMNNDWWLQQLLHILDESSRIWLV